MGSPAVNLLCELFKYVSLRPPFVCSDPYGKENTQYGL